MTNENEELPPIDSLSEDAADDSASDVNALEEGPTRAGFAAIIGAPNAGKSTLVNALVGSKVSIVTRKVQTTRFPVRGVAMEGRSQIVLVDTPGVFTPRRRLDRAMVRSAWAGAEDADSVVHLIDAETEIAMTEGTSNAAQRRSADDAESIITTLKPTGRPAILVINKIDLVKRDKLLALADRLFKTGVYGEAFMVSAVNGSGMADLKQRLAAIMPESPWLYPEDQTADVPIRLLAAEITREKIYLRVHEELPYAAAVETTAFAEAKDGGARIEQTIYVERESQRPIILGKGGQTLKWIGQKSREELAEILDRPIHLFLHVKVHPDWQEDKSFYRGMGLEYDA
jgi:GTP-binding protein Era